MKHFFSKLIITALVLTAPLSFTGDRCPDFKPDCVKTNYAEKVRTTIAVPQQRTAPRSWVSIPRVTVVQPTQHYTESGALVLRFTFLTDPLHGRSPPPC